MPSTSSRQRRPLTMSRTRPGPPQGLLHHSDRGVQYASGEYRELLKAGGLEPSMSRKGNPYRQRQLFLLSATTIIPQWA